MKLGGIPIKTRACVLSQIVRFVIFGHQSYPTNMCDLAFRAAKREGKAWQFAAKILWRNRFTSAFCLWGGRFTCQPPSLLSKLQENQQGSLPERSSVNDLPSVNQLIKHWKECIHWFILGPGKAIIVCTESCCILKMAVLASFWIERLASLASLALSGWPFLLTCRTCRCCFLFWKPSQSWLPWLSQMVLLELAILHMLNGSCDSFVLVLNTAAEHLLCGMTWLAVLKVFSSKLPVRTGCSSIACEPHYVTTSTWSVQMHRRFFVTQGS